MYDAQIAVYGSGRSVTRSEDYRRSWLITATGADAAPFLCIEDVVQYLLHGDLSSRGSIYHVLCVGKFLMATGTKNP